MIDGLKHFLAMGGYGFYVFSAYLSVLVFLFVQWFIPWRRFRKYSHSTHSTLAKLEKERLSHESFT